ncbi:protein SAD1/UNC-84 domain protein 2-like [Chenopodium quinoa]|uniref:protein SAD1/UNC-84 domain protein 2-like n=1 Tax=Chenopodium quinoa TaxID=63459 RepID=UPI000B796297|nr:protein SAD1/UNC-84 domain protein 2-like [Chenopodium quinoa]
MSASTVSGTANPRRRASAVSDMKQGIDIVNDATNSLNLDNNSNKNVAGDVGGDKVTSGSKDLSHSIRGEAVIERSKEKKSSQLPHSNAALRTRNRKVATAPQKPPKPRWVTVMSVLIKNLLLLLVLLGFVQIVRKLVANSGNMGGSGSLMGFSDVEGRIAGVESSLKTTTKMLQVQVEVVDKKIDSEVGNLRREVSRKIEDKSGEIGAQLRKLEEKSEGLELGLVELRSKELLTKDDVVKLYDELKRGDGGGNIGLSFDEIRGLAREVVEKEIEKHAADGLGSVDYAVASGGARVISHSEPLGGFGNAGSWLNVGNKGVHHKAVKMLSPSFGEPGECFPLTGSNGFVVIQLKTAIVPEAITLEHVAESVAFDRSSAPKNCRVSGWLQGKQGLEIDTVDREEILLTEFVYDLKKSNAQTFNVLDEARSFVINTIRFDLLSNHGNSLFTCIYRLRVHGHEPKSFPVISADS